VKTLVVLITSIAVLAAQSAGDGALGANHPKRAQCLTAGRGASPRCLAGKWYHPTSVWNTPIPAQAPVAPNSGSLIASFNEKWCKGGGCLGPTPVSVPSVWTATRTTPLVTVQINYPSCNARQVRAPIPPGAIASAPLDPEPSMAVMVPRGGVEWDFFKLTPPGATPLSSGPVCPATGNWAATVAARAKPGWTGSGSLSGAPRASGTLLGSGLIRPRDTRAPVGATWDHALAFAYPGTLARARVWPALASDGPCTDAASCLPMGARLQLDPSIDCARWPTTTAEWQRQLCRTLQRYGMIVVDTGSGLLVQNPVSVGSYAYPWAPGWAALPADLAPHLRVIDWARWTGRRGG